MTFLPVSFDEYQLLKEMAKVIPAGTSSTRIPLNTPFRYDNAKNFIYVWKPRNRVKTLFRYRIFKQ